jgi:hypothetical protein
VGERGRGEDMKFTVEIEMGNAAMETREDVADALSMVSLMVREGQESGKVRDINGNTVGKFTFTREGKGAYDNRGN